MSHRARVYLVDGRPLPDATCDAALLTVAGQRADAKPFAAWLTGEHEFRTAYALDMGALLVRVFPVGEQGAVATVRRALLDVALRFGLVISTSEGGRGRWVTTARGRDYAARTR